MTVWLAFLIGTLALAPLAQIRSTAPPERNPAGSWVYWHGDISFEYIDATMMGAGKLEDDPIGEVFSGSRTTTTSASTFAPSCGRGTPGPQRAGSSARSDTSSSAAVTVAESDTCRLATALIRGFTMGPRRRSR
jgi:hypothetical protein